MIYNDDKLQYVFEHVKPENHKRSMSVNRTKPASFFKERPKDRMVRYNGKYIDVAEIDLYKR